MPLNVANRACFLLHGALPGLTHKVAHVVVVLVSQKDDGDDGDEHEGAEDDGGHDDVDDAERIAKALPAESDHGRDGSEDEEAAENYGADVGVEDGVEGVVARVIEGKWAFIVCGSEVDPKTEKGASADENEDGDGAVVHTNTSVFVSLGHFGKSGVGGDERLRVEKGGIFSQINGSVQGTTAGGRASWIRRRALALRGWCGDGGLIGGWW